jgi:hypothetical protein
LTSTTISQPSAGGEIYDIKSNIWSKMDDSDLKILPSLSVDSAQSMGELSSIRYLFGAAKNGQAELWRIDIKGWSAKKVWQNPGPGNGPNFRRGASLFWDAANKRLMLLVIDGALQLWTWTPGLSKTWKFVLQDSSIASGRVHLFGVASMTDPLAFITFPLAGPKPKGRLVKSSSNPVLQPWLANPPGWWGPMNTIWLASEQQMLVSRAITQQGLLRNGISHWRRVCSKP